VSGIWHPYRGQLSADSPGQLQSMRRSVFTRSPALTGTGWRYYRTGVPAPSVAVQPRSRRTGPHNRIAIFNRTQFLYQFTNGLTSIWYYSNRVHSPSSSATATAIVSAWTSKPTNFILFTDRLLSHVALRFGLTDSQRNPRAANRSRSFHGDNLRRLMRHFLAALICVFFLPAFTYAAPGARSLREAARRSFRENADRPSRCVRRRRNDHIRQPFSSAKFRAAVWRWTFRMPHAFQAWVDAHTHLLDDRCHGHCPSSAL